MPNLARQVERAAAKRMREFRRAMAGQHRCLARLVPLDEALADPRLASGVVEMLVAAARPGIGRQSRECAVCCGRWGIGRMPEAILVVEYLGSDRALASAVCSPCAAAPDAGLHLLKAIERDIGGVHDVSWITALGAA